MILVTGSMRSGTSMWMQILGAAGFPTIGAPFPGKWGSTIGHHNARGFHESIFRRGIHAATNPNPRTGRFVSPALTRRHVVKVFATGLARTEPRYIDDFVLTVRNWRSFARSRERLLADEHESFERLSGRVLPPREQVPPLLEWITDQAVAIRTIRQHNLRGRIIAYERALSSPDVIAEVVEALGADPDAARDALDLRAHRVRDVHARPDDFQGLDPALAHEVEDVADALHGALLEGRAIDRATLGRLDSVWQRCRGPRAAAEARRSASQKRWRQAKR